MIFLFINAPKNIWKKPGKNKLGGALKMSKIRFENSNSRKKSTNKGFYIALGICLVAVGAASLTTYKSVKSYMKPTDPVTNESSFISENNTQVNHTLQGTSDMDLENTSDDEEATVKQANANKSKDDNQNTEATKEELIIFPSGHEIIKNFSDVNPVYSKTLSDWRIHTGTDFKAENGSIVKSMNSGIVTDVFNDPSLGMTIVIEHDQGFVSYYSGLGDTVMVKKDDRVTTGQDIGSINDVPAEISDGPHLHLGIKKDGNWVDPMSILKSE